MNSISNLAKENLKFNKSRNMLVGITMILATCLLVSIGIISFSIKQSIQNSIIEQTGSFHGSFAKVSSKQLEVLKSNRNVQNVGEMISIGEADLGKGKLNLSLLYADASAADMLDMKLAEGKLPESKDEIAMEKWMIESLGFQPKIGESIHLKVAGSHSENDQEDGVHEKTFKISGILRNNNSNMNAKMSHAIVSKELATEIPRDFSALVRVKGRSGIEGTLHEVAEEVQAKDGDVSINEQYVKTLAVSPEDLAPVVLVALVVIFAAVVVISNIFNISVAARIKQFGLLASIGATPKQIKSLVFKEGIKISLISIPIGVAVGYVVSYAVSRTMVLTGNVLEFKSTLSIVLASIAISLITVVFSLGKPCRTASRISPVEATRYSGAKFNSKKKERKGSKNINLRQLAYLNLWRNKKRTLLTMLSLTMGGVLFIVFSTILCSMNMENAIDMYIRGDFELRAEGLMSDMKLDPLSNEIVDQIKNFDGVERVDCIMSRMAFIPNSVNLKVPDGTDKPLESLNCGFYGYNEKMLGELGKYLAKGVISVDSMKNNDEILMVVPKDSRYFKDAYKVGDRISVTFKNDGESIQREFVVAGIVEDDLADASRGMGPTMITHESTYARSLNDSRASMVRVYAGKNSVDGVSKRLRSIASDNSNITMNTRQEKREELSKDMKGIRTASMSLVCIIGLIGMLNLINTMITSILSRKKEIGMLQAIGLSNKQLVKMLQMEGMHYSGISAALSVVLGSTLGYFFFIQFNKVASYSVYEYPLIPVLSLVAAFIALQALITFLVTNNLKKESMIERIRYSE